MVIKSANAWRKRYPPAKPVAQTGYCDAVWWGRWWRRKRCTAPCERLGANGSVTLRVVGVGGGGCAVFAAPRYCVALHCCVVGASSSVVVWGKHARWHYAHHRHHTHATTEHDADNTEEREGRHYTHAPLRGLPTHTVGIYADSCLERSDPYCAFADANGRHTRVDGALTIKRNSKIQVGENGNVEQR